MQVNGRADHARPLQWNCYSDWWSSKTAAPGLLCASEVSLHCPSSWPFSLKGQMCKGGHNGDAFTGSGARVQAFHMDTVRDVSSCTVCARHQKLRMHCPWNLVQVPSSQLVDLVKEWALKLLHCTHCPVDINGPWDKVLRIGPQKCAAHADAILPLRQKSFPVLQNKTRFQCSLGSGRSPVPVRLTINCQCTWVRYPWMVLLMAPTPLPQPQYD